MDSGFGSNLNSSLTCSCGRVFGQLNALSNHRRSCRTAKKRLSDALSSAKEAFQAKRRRLSLECYMPVIEPGLIPSSSLAQEDLEPDSSILPENSAQSLDPVCSYKDLFNTLTNFLLAPGFSRC